MSAKLETLHENLTAVQSEIEVRTKSGQPCEDLLEQLEDIKSQLRNARKLLVESSANSILKD